MTAIDISPEAVERTINDLWERAKATEARQAELMIRALSAALTQSRAETAAAYERAAKITFPADVLEFALKIGRAEWGQTDPKTAAEHGVDMVSTVEKTAAHFGQTEPQSLNGLYIEGTGIVICHTGVSPNSPETARRAVEHDLRRSPGRNQAMITTREAALEAALKLARNRLQACAIDHPTGSREMYERSEWADEATRALATPDQSSAFAAIEAAAEARGMRKAAEIVSEQAIETDSTDAAFQLGDASRAILAAIPQGDTTNA